MKLQMTKLISWDISLGCCLPMGEHAPKGLFHSCIKLSDFTVVNCKNTNFSVRTTIAQPHTGSFGKEEITLHFRVSQKSFFATSFPLFFFQFFPLKPLKSRNPSSHNAFGISGLLLAMHWATLQQHGSSASWHNQAWRCRDIKKSKLHVPPPWLASPSTVRHRSLKSSFWVTSNFHFGALLTLLQRFYKPVYKTIDNGRSCWGSQWTYVDNKPLWQRSNMCSQNSRG